MAQGDLVAGRTERERDASARDLEAQRRRRADQARNEILRECPTGFAYDAAHALVLLSDLGGASRSRVLQRTFLIRALMAHGWSASELGQAFAMDAHQVEDERAREIWWQPTDEVRAALSDEVRVDLADARRDSLRIG